MKTGTVAEQTSESEDSRWKLVTIWTLLPPETDGPALSRSPHCVNAAKLTSY